jgi:hypothetical protein
VSAAYAILGPLGALGLTVGAIVAATYGLFRFLGAKWIEKKFQQILEEFRYEKVRELESLRLEINNKLNRATFLNEREFEVLPALYHRMNVAFDSVAIFTSPVQFHADVDRMKEEELKTLDFVSYEIDDVRSYEPRSERYQNIVFWKQLNSTFILYTDFNNYLISNSIFVDDDLRQHIESIRDLMSDALHEARCEKEYPNPRPGRWSKRDALRAGGEPKIDIIRKEVRGRLIELRTLEPSHANG